MSEGKNLPREPTKDEVEDIEVTTMNKNTQMILKTMMKVVDRKLRDLGWEGDSEQIEVQTFKRSWGLENIFYFKVENDLVFGCSLQIRENGFKVIVEENELDEKKAK